MLHLVLAVALAASSPAADMYAAPARRVSVGGRRLNLVCRGSGHPAVVLDAGLGDWSPTWIRIQSRLAARTTVCSFDRAGYGFSDAGPPPRTAFANARDLHDLLHAAQLPAPYVLVGHSFGGLDVQAFTERYRVEVAGIVLVDATPDDLAFPPVISPVTGEQIVALQKCAASARAGAFVRQSPSFAACFNMLWGTSSQPNSGVTPALVAAVKQQARKPAPYDAAVSETQHISESQRQVHGYERALGDLPLVVLTATTHGENEMPQPLRRELHAFEAPWRRAHERMASLSSRGRYELVKSGHYIQFDRPDVVIEAVEAVLNPTR